MTLDELIDWLPTAPADWVADLAIWNVLHPDITHATAHPRLPRYTTSIDAAVGAIPPGWTRAVDASAPELDIDVELFGPNEAHPRIKRSHATEPMATMLAALDAIKYTRETQNG